MNWGKPPELSWSQYVRQAISFVLGAALVIHAVIKKGANTGELIVGLLLMGVVPVDALFDRLGLSKKRNGSVNGNGNQNAKNGGTEGQSQQNNPPQQQPL